MAKKDLVKKVNPTAPEAVKVRRNAKLLRSTSSLAICTASMILAMGVCLPNSAMAACNQSGSQFSYDCTGLSTAFSNTTALSVSLEPNASVSGTTAININNATVNIKGPAGGFPGGTVTGNTVGIQANSVTVTNAGTIQAIDQDSVGINGGNNVHVINNASGGLISGGDIGIYAATISIDTNQGTIQTTGNGRFAIFGTDITIGSRDAVTGVVTGSNAGKIEAVNGTGIHGNGNVHVIDNASTGLISGGSRGISATTVNVDANEGTIQAGSTTTSGAIAIFGVDVTIGRLDATTGAVIGSNAGTIQALGADSVGIESTSTGKVHIIDNASTGIISGDSKGIIATTVNVDANEGTIRSGNATTSGDFAIFGTDVTIGRLDATTGAVIGSNAGTIQALGADSTGIHGNGNVHVIDNASTGLISGGSRGISATTVNVDANEGTIQAGSTTTSGAIAIFGVDVTIGRLDATTGAVIGSNAGTIQALGADSVGIQSTSTGKVHIIDNASTGIITGKLNGIQGGSVTVDANAGTISGGNTGISATTITNVTNSGTISGLNSSGISATTISSMINSGTIAGGDTGISATAITNMTNSGMISGGNNYGISATNVVVSNSGTVAGGTSGILASGTANIGNSGTISGNNNGIVALNATVTNSGTITGTFVDGISANNLSLDNTGGTITGGRYGVIVSSANITSSGNIFGNVGILVGGTGNVITTGTISGSGGTAIQFNLNSVGNDNLTLGTTNTFINGKVILGGGSDTVLVHEKPINDAIWFDSLNGVNVSTDNNVKYFVVGNELCFSTGCAFAGVQQLAFGIAPLMTAVDIDLNDFARGVSSMIPALDDAGPAAPMGAASLGFEAEDQNHKDAFANIPGLSAYGSDGMAFKSPTVVLPDGRAVWARGFGGERQQQADGLMPHLSSSFYGGAVGGDFLSSWAGRVGGFFGAGASRASVQTAGSTNSDIIFGGLYGRYNFGAAFLHAAVQGGGTRNHVTQVFDPLSAPEKGSFDGWYVSPEVTLGYRYALGDNYTLTPSLQVRYLTGHFDSFTQTGSTLNLAVDGHSTQSVEERGEVKLSHVTNYTPSSAVLSSVSGGIIGLQNVGDDTLSTTFAGLEVPFALLNKDSVVGGFGDVSVELRHNNISVYAAGEAIGFSNSATVLSGRGGMRVSF